MATSNDTPNTITIQLTQGQVTVIDAIDSDLCAFKWAAAKRSSGNNYNAMRSAPNGKGGQVTTYLHRVILERMLNRPLLKSELVDHKDCNPLNNTRSNIRLASHNQNAQNASISKRNTTGYKGVTYRKSTNRYRALIAVNGKTRELGTFLTAEEAYEAYCKAAIELHGEFANFG